MQRVSLSHCIAPVDQCAAASGDNLKRASDCATKTIFSSQSLARTGMSTGLAGRTVTFNIADRIALPCRQIKRVLELGIMQAQAHTSSPALPRWMRESRRGIDWGVLLAIILSAAAAWAFLLQPGLPRTNASENYVFRTTDYAETLLEGRLYPRWSPNVFSGYGSPIPNYFPPGAPYTAALIQIFLTDNPVDAVRVLYAISLTLAGTMVYVLVTRRAGSAAGLLSATLYAYSPYVGMIAPHVLGDLPGVMALALIPALLWSVDRLLVLNRAQDFPLVVFITTLLLVTDLRYAAAGLALALLFVVWQILRGIVFRRGLFALAAFLVGMLLASFYWFPALLEFIEVRWRPSLAPYNSFYLDATQLLLPLRQVDLAELLITPQFTLGVTHTLFALFGVIGVFIYRAKVRFQAFFLTLGIALLLVLVTIFPSQVWLLGVVMLCLSIGSSSFVALRERFLPRLLLPITITVILATSSSVWLSPLWEENFGDVSPAAQVDYERQGFGIAVLPAGTFIPSTISENLAANRFLLEGYQSGGISKILPEQITPTTQVGTLAHYTHADSVQITTTIPTRLEILTAYFPGWSASLGGEALLVSPEPNTGLIEISIPETRNSELTVALHTTPIRTTAWVVSWSALAAVIVMGWLGIRRQERLFNELNLLTTEETRLTAVVVGCFLVVIVLFAFPASPVSLRAPAGHALQGTTPLRSLSDIGLQAIAYNLPNDRYRQGETIEVEIFWRSLRALPENYQITAYLVSADDSSLRWYDTPLRHPGAYPTRRWVPNRYVRDTYTFPLSTGIIPGSYFIAFEVYNCNPFCLQQTRANFFDNDGAWMGQVLILPTTITITP